MMQQPMTIVGKTCAVDIVGHAFAVLAKVDTGADSSSIWASHISIDQNNILHFTLFDTQSPHYTGEVISTDTFSVAQVRSSSGHVQIRYRVQFSVRIAGKRIKATFNLSDRSQNNYSILIGRRTLSGKFLVDVQQGEQIENPYTETVAINDELRQNPYAFFEKYHHNTNNG